MTTAFGHKGTTWRQKFRSFKGALVDVIFPPVCASCGREGALLCAACRKRIVWVKEPICGKCGRFMTVGTKRCFTCVQAPLPLERIRSAVFYGGPVADTIKKFKYEGYFGLAEPLANLMLKGWSIWEWPVDIVIPIPLHPARLRERGYNQSEMLAQVMQRELGWQVESSGLKRVRHTQPQVGLNSEERRANVWGAFETNPEFIENKNVLLIDDVRTTGATLVAAANTLLSAGAKSVSAYCLAGAGNEKDSIEKVDA